MARRAGQRLLVGLAVVTTAAFVAAVVLDSRLAFVAGPVAVVAHLLAARALVASAATTGPGTDPRPTGRVLQPQGPTFSPARRLPGGGWAWVGGARIPGPLGWLRASGGLAVLELEPTGLTLRVRGGRLLGARPLRVAPTGSVRCYPVRGRFPGTTGVAIDEIGSAPGYFWTRSTREILSALQWAGYRVSWDESRPTWW